MIGARAEVIDQTDDDDCLYIKIRGNISVVASVTGGNTIVMYIEVRNLM